MRRAPLHLVIVALSFLGACDTSPPVPVRAGQAIKESNKLAEKKNRKATEDVEATPVAPVAMLRELELVSHVGGTHYRTVVVGNRWYQTFSNTLLVLDSQRGSVLGRTELGEFGATGAAVDLAVDGSRMLVVLDGDGVIEFELGEGGPTLKETAVADVLGIRPRRVSASRGDFWIAGDGGVVRWSDRTRFLSAGVDGAAGTVVHAASGPVACVGRRVHALGSGEFVGAASELIELPAGGRAALAFALQGKDGASVGLMGSDVRELGVVAVPGTVRRLRWFDNRLWCVTDGGIRSWSVVDTRLADPREIKVKGARDVDQIDHNVLAVAGSFGRALYRRAGDRGKAGDEFFSATREASRLAKAISDGRRILAGSDEEGHWLYLLGAEAELSDRSLSTYQQPVQKITGTWGSAEITEGAKIVRCQIDGNPIDYSPKGRPDLYCLAAVDEAIWIGHSSGIDVIERADGGGARRVGSLRLEGPVRYIYPKWDNGAAYVAEFGGFGVAKIRSRPLDASGTATAATPQPGDTGDPRRAKAEDAADAVRARVKEKLPERKSPRPGDGEG